MLKRFLLFLIVVVSAATVALLTLPWWLGGVLRWQGAKYGLEYAEYQTVGYTRWALTDVQLERPGWILAIDRVEVPHVLGLWWKKSSAAPIDIGRIDFALREREGEATGESATITPGELHALIAELSLQVPEVRVDELVVTGMGPNPINISDLTWSSELLQVAQIRFREHEIALSAERTSLAASEASAAFFGTPGLSVTITTADGSSNLALECPEPFAPNYNISVNGNVLGQRLLGDVMLSTDSWLPTQLNLAGGLNLPDGSTDTGIVYHDVEGAWRVEWQDETYDLQLDLTGAVEFEAQTSGISVAAKAHGTLAETTIDTLHVTLPGLSLNLNEPVRFANDDIGGESQSRFDLRADLESLPWVTGQGEINGTMDVTSAGLGWPRVAFDLSLDDVVWNSLDRVYGSVKGRAHWPDWELSEVSLNDAAGNQFTITGVGSGGEIQEADWRVILTGDLVADWLPEGWAFEKVEADGVLQGDWPNLVHRGQFSVGQFAGPGLQPLAGAGNWQGQQLEISGKAQLTAGDSSLELEGSGREDGARLQVRLSRAGTAVFETLDPIEIVFGDGFEVSGLEVRGPSLSASSERFTSSVGRASFSLEDPDWSWLGAWLIKPPAVPLIRTASGSISWEADQLTGNIEFDGDVPLGEEQSLSVSLAANSNGSELEVSDGRVGWMGSTVAEISGRLPIQLSRVAPYWEIDREGEIDAQLALQDSENVWEELGKLTRIKVEKPQLEATVSGTWSRPRGQGFLAADRISFAPEESEDLVWPEVTELVARLVDDGSGLVVDPLTTKIDGQVVTFRGELPLTPAEWSELSEDPISYFQDKGRGALEIPRAELSAFAKFLPAYLVPTGQLEVSLNYAPGEGANGRIQLLNAVSRPLGPLGVVQNINADLNFRNRTMTIDRVSALMGGQPLSLTGTAGWPAEGEVEVDLRLRGDNLPIVRKTGILLRSDLALRITSDAEGNGRVSGEAILRDGLVLVDVRSLVPTAGSSVSVPSRRPPYFSVSVPPLNDWDLQVALRGENFLRLRTPVIVGTGSLRARLDGTLGNPRLLGEMELQDSTLRLPFARLVVDEAMVRLTEADPYDPEIWLEATGQRIGYDLRMELEGKASEPQLTLQSSPALTSEEVLMLVMAGVTPNDDADLLNADRALRLGVYFGQGLLGDLFGTDESERLTVSTGEKLSRLGKETYEFEYEFADRWSVVGEYDEFDYYNAAVKWRVRPGKQATAPDEESTDQAETGGDDD